MTRAQRRSHLVTWLLLTPLLAGLLALALANRARLPAQTPPPGAVGGQR